MVDLSTAVGEVWLPNPVMTASGTAGHGAELQRYVPLDSLAAVVVKSLSIMPWEGNPAPRVMEIPGGMMNSVGLQGPGVGGWIQHELPQLRATGARVVASIWGRTLDEYRAAADALATVQSDLIAVEVNVSCPNIEDRRRMFAHSSESAAAVIEVTGSLDVPRWAKLSPNVADIAEIAGAVSAAGAEAVTLTNTLLGLALDAETGRPRLGGGGGGVSGPAIRPVALRAVFDVHAAHPELPIIGVGGIAEAEHVVQYLRAGASAVQVGTATFANPRSIANIIDELEQWCRKRGVQRATELIGTAHREARHGNELRRS